MDTRPVGTEPALVDHSIDGRAQSGSQPLPLPLIDVVDSARRPSSATATATTTTTTPTMRMRIQNRGSAVRPVEIEVMNT